MNNQIRSGGWGGFGMDDDERPSSTLARTAKSEHLNFSLSSLRRVHLVPTATSHYTTSYTLVNREFSVWVRPPSFPLSDLNQSVCCSSCYPVVESM